MAIVGWEWIVIVGVVIIFFLWGPSKIPQLARAIGQAGKELRSTFKESTSPSEEKPVTGGPDDALVDTAKRLGIATEGKTREEISKEIVQESSAGKATSSSA